MKKFHLLILRLFDSHAQTFPTTLVFPEIRATRVNIPQVTFIMFRLSILQVNLPQQFFANTLKRRRLKSCSCDIRNQSKLQIVTCKLLTPNS